MMLLLRRHASSSRFLLLQGVLVLKQILLHRPRVLLVCTRAQPRMLFLVAHLLRTQDEFLLSIEESLSGLALAAHHELGCEVASAAVGAHFSPHSLSLYALGHLVLLMLH